MEVLAEKQVFLCDSKQDIRAGKLIRVEGANVF